MLNEIEIVKPMDIEKRSMAIITEELGGRTWPEPEFSIVKRCIHTSADFDYADNLCFSEHAAQIGVEALNRGASIVTDTQMAASGINKKRMKECGGEVYCFMSDPDVAAEAKERGCTRAAVCMERAAALQKQIEEAQKESESLEEEEIYIQTKKYVEDVARSRLGLVKPGETYLKPNSEE